MLEGQHGIVAPHHALHQNGERGDRLQPRQIAPRDRRVPVSREELRQRRRGGVRRRGVVVAAGERLAQGAPQIGDTHLRRQMKAIEQIALASAKKRCIHREHQRGAAGAFGPLHEFRGHAAIAIDVQLEPEWPRGAGAHGFDRAVGQRGEDHPRARVLRRLRGGHFAVGVGELLKGHRGHEHGPVHLLPEHGGALRPHGHVAQYPVSECAIAPCRARAAQQQFVVRAAGVVVVHHAGEPVGGRGLEPVQVDQWRRGVHAGRLLWARHSARRSPPGQCTSHDPRPDRSGTRGPHRP